MKKLLFLMIFLFVSLHSYSADLLFGGGVALTSNKSGGFGEVGVTMYKNSSFQLRNIISINGYGINSGFSSKDSIPLGYFGFTEKITFGLSNDYILNSNSFVIPYGFIAGNFSFIGSKDNQLFEAPYSYDIYAGFGADIYSFKNTALFIEAYGGYEAFTCNVAYFGNKIGVGYAGVNVGIRGFLNK